MSDGGPGGGPRDAYSPAEEALLLLHERIVDAEAEVGEGGEDEGMEPRPSRGGGFGGGAGGRVASRLVVPRAIVGCILGKGGKIVEQMREETRTQIRVLPRDHKLPRCVSSSEEIVQVSTHLLAFDSD